MDIASINVGFLLNYSISICSEKSNNKYLEPQIVDDPSLITW